MLLSNSSLIVVLLLLVILLQICHVVVLGRCYTSLYSFGDSITDTGNGFYCNPDKLPFNYPYGETYFHKPTGRCSNGRLMIDFFAQALGLPFLPPYLGHEKDDLSQGVNFAVAGATAVDPTFFMEYNVTPGDVKCSLRVQLGWFKQHLRSLCTSPSDCKRILRNVLFVIGEIGGNDYPRMLLQRKDKEWIRSFVPNVVDVISTTITALIEEGVMTLMVTGLPRIGCFGGLIVSLGVSNKGDFDNSTGCVTWLNEFCQFHNIILQNELKQLRKRHHHATIIYVDYYNATSDLYYFTHELGFTCGALTACCGKRGGPYNYNRSILCGNKECNVCDDPSLYVSWDGMHYTEKAYKWVASRILEGSFTFPHFNISCLSSNSDNVDHPSYL